MRTGGPIRHDRYNRYTHRPEKDESGPGDTMSQAILRDVESSLLKTDLPALAVGDTVDVHVRITEGAKERIQVYNGVIISRRGSGINETITVRRIVANEGVERIFPIHSPRIAQIEVRHHGHTRRAKLYYLRERVGKKRRLRDRRRGLGHLVTVQEPAPAEVEINDESPPQDEASEAAAEADGGDVAEKPES